MPLGVALTAELTGHGRDSEPLDLTRKACRLLAESAALVLVQRTGMRLENLG